MIRRYFIITKRGKPLKFIEDTSNDYRIVESEKDATILTSMVELMNKLNTMLNSGDAGLWYKEVEFNEPIDEHEYIMQSIIDTELRYVSYKDAYGTPYWTKRKSQAIKFKELSEALEFALEKLPKDTINELRIIDLKEAESNLKNTYLYSKGGVEDEILISQWERLTDYEAFSKFSELIDQRLDTTIASDIFKKQMIKLIGTRKYAIIETDQSRKAAKNALINIFSKLIELDFDEMKDENGHASILYIEWYIRNKLMTKEENKWLIRTKWFLRNKGLM